MIDFKETLCQEVKRKSIHIVGMIVIPLDFYFGFMIPGILIMILSCLYILSEYLQEKEKQLPMMQTITKFPLAYGKVKPVALFQGFQ